MHLVFTTVLFTIAKTWKLPKCPSTNEWIKKSWCIYTQWNVTQPLKGMKCHLWHMNGARDDHIKQSESDRERQIEHICRT